MKIQMITVENISGGEPIIVGASGLMAVRFFPEDGEPEKWIDVQVRVKEDGISIMASRAIEVLPKSSNVVIIRTERD